jgi:hypothetical protein
VIGARPKINVDTLAQRCQDARVKKGEHEMQKIERKFWVTSEMIKANAWVASTLSGDVADEILVAYWNPLTKAQLDAKFSFIFIKGEPYPKFETFADGWDALAELGPAFIEMLAALSERKLGHVPRIEEVVSGLESLGFERQLPANDR